MIETEHVWKQAMIVDGGDRFFACVIAGVSHQVNKELGPTVPIVYRLAGVVFLFGLVGVEEATD